jgi:peroxiredoxin family protein
VLAREAAADRLQAQTQSEPAPKPKRLALVASKGTLDMVYPPLILAANAASLGWEVGVYCTFYGLDLLHKKRNKHLKVSAVGNPAMPAPLRAVPVKVPEIIGMLPGMANAATAMMKGWMRKSKMPTVEEFLEMCRESGVRFFACATTMGVMGIAQSDLIDQVECAGATTFLDFAAGADVSLFI